MSLLSQASLVVVPSGYKEDVVYSVKPTDGSGDLTFTRASDGTRVNSQGLVERVPWNLLQQSNTFSTTWTNTSSTETSGQSGYDGSLNAWKIDISAAFGQIIQNLPISGYNTVSIYAKAGTLGFCRLRCDASTNAIADFDLSDGSLAYSFGIISATSENVGNGWFRLQMYFNATATNLRIYPIVAANNLTATSGNIYIQDAQINEGSLKPYFPTTDRQNVPRLDYSNGCPSLLLEPQRTNSLTYSEQFDNAAWLKGNISVTANNATSPDGTQNADTIVDDSTNYRHILYQQFSGDFATSRTFSLYAKENSLRYLFMSVTVGGDSHCYSAIFDLQSGTVSATKTNGDATLSASIVNAGNGWYRCIISGTMTTGTGNYFPLIGTSDRAGFTGSLVNNNAPVYIGSGQSVYIWGAQLEAGSYPTSYIPTTSASVTRVADGAYKTGISSLIGQTEGTIFLDFNSSNVADSSNSIYGISNGTTSSRVLIYFTSNRIDAQVRDSGVTQAVFAGVTMASNTNYKCAIAYKANDVAFYINGTQIGLDTSATIPAMSDVRFDSGGGATPCDVPVNQALLFKTRLTNAELAALTTI